VIRNVSDSDTQAIAIVHQLNSRILSEPREITKEMLFGREKR
jgi:hypothetical protein